MHSRATNTSPRGQTALRFTLLSNQKICITIYIYRTTLPIATTILVILNVVVLALGLFSGAQQQVIRRYGFIPDQLLSVSPSSSLSDILTRLFTSMFIHANIVHLAFNLMALVYLGGYAERAVGIARYILIYIIAGRLFQEYQAQQPLLEILGLTIG